MIPIVGAAFDYVENILVRIALSSFPNNSRAELTASVTVTTIKLVLSYASQWLAGISLVLGLIHVVQTRGKRSGEADQWRLAPARSPGSAPNRRPAW